MTKELIVLLAFFSLTGCQLENNTKESVEIANPSSVFCIEQGGELVAVSGENGTSSNCKLPDGREIDTWEFFRQENAPVEKKEDYIGLSEESGAALAEKNGVMFRVVERDGAPLPATKDLRPGRINAVVVDGLITSFTVEGLN